MKFRQQRFLPLFLLALAGAAMASGTASTAPEQPMVQAAQKPGGSGVGVRYRVQGTPAVGKPTQVEIMFGRVRDANGATLQFTADPSLQLDAGGVPTTLAAGENTRVTVTVTPRQEGLAYLNVFTTQRGATSSTSIPIQTGAAGVSSSKKGMAGSQLKDAPDGDKILSMPVK